ncbi:MAG: flavin reductase family protein [Pikeienuella sp.]
MLHVKDLLEVGPGAAEPFRKVWRGVAGTVAVVATEHEGERRAMLATAVTSLSMDPPSLLVCVNRSAAAHQALIGRGAFTLGILGADEVGLGAHLAATRGEARFTRGEWSAISAPDPVLDGLPALEGGQALLVCRLDRHMDYGSHCILIGRVDRASRAENCDPLLYCDGMFGGFAAAPKPG